MYKTITECMTGGGAYSSYIRIDLSTGDVLTKKAELVSKHRGNGKMSVTKSVALSKKEIVGDIKRISFTDSVGGYALIGGNATVSDGDSGELSTVVTLTLTLTAPSGFKNSEKLFDVLTGSEPLDITLFTAADQDGANLVILPSISSTAITLGFGFYRAPTQIAIYYGGEPAFTTPVSEIKDETRTVTVSANCEIYGNGINPTKIQLLNADTNAEYEGSLVLRYPVSPLGEECKLPMKPCGKMQANGDVLAFVDDGCVRLYGKGFTPIAERNISELKSFAFTQSGYCVLSDDNGLTVFKGGRDFFTLDKDAKSVAISDGRHGVRIYCTDGENVECYGVNTTTGKITRVYAVECKCLGIVTHNESLMVVVSNGTKIISANGTVGNGVTISYGTVVGIADRTEGMALVNYQNGLRSELFYKTFKSISFTPIAISGRIYNMTVYGKNVLALMGEEDDEQLAVLDADDMAFAHGRLYYRKGENIYYRDAEKCKAVVLNDNITENSRIAVREVCETNISDSVHTLNILIGIEG